METLQVVNVTIRHTVTWMSETGMADLCLESDARLVHLPVVCKADLEFLMLFVR